MPNCPKTIYIKQGKCLSFNNESMPGLNQISVYAGNKNAIDFRILACPDENPNCRKYFNWNDMNKNTTIKKLCQIGKITPIYRIGGFPNPKVGRANIYYIERGVDIKYYLFIFVRKETETYVINSLMNSINELNLNIQNAFFHIMYDDSSAINGSIIISLWERYEKLFGHNNFRIYIFDKTKSYELHNSNNSSTGHLELKEV
jgi:hypothetical protein